MVRAAGISALIALALCAGCAKKKAPQERAIDAIVRTEPNVRARALRAEVEKLTAAKKLDAAAAKAEPLERAVGDILQAMDQVHHMKTAVPDFEVLRYIEALRDLGENLRGFARIYSSKNPESLKRDMLQGLIDQLKQKIR